MDTILSGTARRKRRARQLLWVAAGGVLIAAVTAGLAALRPGAPSLDRSSVWTDTVRRGDLLRQVHGVGMLAAEDIRWIPAVTEGRVERILVEPGTAVSADTVLLELSNPELDLQVADAESQARAARAQFTELQARLAGQRLDQEAALARVQAEYAQAQLKQETQERLATDGLVAALDVKMARVTAAETANRRRIEEERLAAAVESIRAQFDVARLQVEQKEGALRLKRSQRGALRVRSGMPGVLQLVSVEVGQRVPPGANMARVAQPTRLKAVVKVPEIQAKDLQLGQKAAVDTRNGVVSGHVSRVDPAVQGGSVTVDISLDGALPKGARPDLTIDATVDVERLLNVLCVGRPAQTSEAGVQDLFRLEPNGVLAIRTPVRLGRASVTKVEVVGGLKEGDQVIVSDMSAWDQSERVRLR